MRIDDENKVVWCSESEISWYNSFVLNGGRDNSFANLRRINALSTEKEVVLPSYMTVTDRVELIRAISNNFEFKLEQPQKYYWRKKKEYLVWFEDFESVLIMSKHSKILRFGDISSYDNRYFEGRFTEQEARDLLKDDFDKFEKVECE